MIARFLSRTFTALADELQPNVNLAVENFTWSATGGPRAATLLAEGAEAQLWDLVAFLGQPLYIYDETGTPEWWGLCTGLDFIGGGVEVSLDLSQLANSVAVAYTQQGDGSTSPNERATTAYITDTDSISLYGTKQILLSGHNMTAEEAAGLRATYLAKYRLPHPRWRHAGGRGQLVARVHCAGLYDTLAWKYYAASISGDVYAPGEVLVSDKNRLGDANANAAVAQSFELTIGASCYIPTVRIYLQKVDDGGLPADSVEVSLRADNAGEPSAVQLDEGTLAVASVDTKLGWHEFALSGDVAFATGTTYWIVVERHPAQVPGGNGYYFVGTDEEAGYASGECYLYDAGAGTWAARGTAADMPFQLVPTWDSITAIADIAGTSECGQFLSGTTHSITSSSGLLAPPYRDGDRTGLDVITSLLEAGGSNNRELAAWVTQQRILEIKEAASQPTNPEIVIGIDGVIRTWTKRARVTPRQVVRRWARIEAAERLERYPAYIYADGQQVIQAAQWSQDGKTCIIDSSPGSFVRSKEG